MSEKRPRRPVEASRARTLRRVASSVLIGGLLTTLVFVFVDRQGRHHESVTASATTVPVTSAPSAALQGSYDITIRVLSADYGATWPATNPRLTPGQILSQTWSIDCRGSACAISITSGHVAEDPSGATVASTDNAVFEVSGSTPASPDSPSLPPGCGAVNATDAQRLRIRVTGGGANFTGQYEVHHPTIHVEGPTTNGTGSCDSFNVTLSITGVRQPR